MTQLLTWERLTIAGGGRGLEHWGTQNPLLAAELVRRDVLKAGSCLPMIWFCGGRVVPVVIWDLDALRARLDRGAGPLLYRSVLADRLAHGRDHLEPAVLRMHAFISVHPLAAGARNALGSVSGFAQAIAAVPQSPGVAPWEADECGYYGFTIAEVDGSAARTVVQGRCGPKHPQGGVPHQRRLMEEQLFDVAIRTGTTPFKEES